MKIKASPPEDIAQEYFKEKNIACPYCNEKKLWGWTEGYEYGCEYDENGQMIGTQVVGHYPVYYICLNCKRDFELKQTPAPTEEHWQYQNEVYKILVAHEKETKESAIIKDSDIDYGKYDDMADKIMQEHQKHKE